MEVKATPRATPPPPPAAATVAPLAMCPSPAPAAQAATRALGVAARPSAGGGTGGTRPGGSWGTCFKPLQVLQLELLAGGQAVAGQEDAVQADTPQDVDLVVVGPVVTPQVESL